MSEELEEEDYSNDTQTRYRHTLERIESMRQQLSINVAAITLTSE
jgi:hypothetical protein